MFGVDNSPMGVRLVRLCIDFSDDSSKVRCLGVLDQILQR